MKYFLDTEFLEGTQKTLFGKIKPTIDLISIGIVAEDGREYYSISKDFNIKEAWNRWQQRTGEGDRNNIEPREYWIRTNILEPIYKELLKKENESNVKGNYMFGFNLPVIKHNFTYKNFKRLVNKYGKSNNQIAKEIKNFIANRPITAGKEQWILDYDTKDVEFYAYYADYDWVVFCWLFGKMLDLPKGFPYYCNDLKQELDRIVSKSWKDVEMSTWGHTGIEDIKKLPNYPKQTNEHNALEDARWNFRLFKFLQTIN